MAIYHLSAQIISRKAGRSATAAAAYRAAESITDERTGEVYDYTRKGGVEYTQLVMPADCDWRPSRADVWNAVEAKNKRGDAQVAREFVVALPSELTTDDRQRLAVDFAAEIATRYSVAADVAIHAPGRGGDERNHHAHILTSTNRIVDGRLGNKVRELDLIAHNQSGGVGKKNEIDWLRGRWESMANESLRAAGIDARIDHRTLAAQGIDRAPTQHLGVGATGYERRTGEQSRRRMDMASAIEARTLELAERQVDQRIIDLSAEIAAANEPKSTKPIGSIEPEWQRRRSARLAYEYDDDMAARHARWYRVSRDPERGVTLQNRTLAVADTGARIDLVHAADDDAQARAIGLMLDMAKAKCWDAIEITGSAAFRAAAARAAVAAGLGLLDQDLQAEFGMKEPAAPAPGADPSDPILMRALTRLRGGGLDALTPRDRGRLEVAGYLEKEPEEAREQEAEREREQQQLRTRNIGQEQAEETQKPKPDGALLMAVQQAAEVAESWSEYLPGTEGRSAAEKALRDARDAAAHAGWSSDRIQASADAGREAERERMERDRGDDLGR